MTVLTHIDQLRPATEWNPPYDLTHPSGTKSRSIADAMEAVREDFALSEGQPLVPACLKPGQEYNIEEGLTPAILGVLSGAQAVRYLRCLRSFHNTTRWKQLWRQTLGAGRVAWKAGQAWLARKK